MIRDNNVRDVHSHRRLRTKTTVDTTAIGAVQMARIVKTRMACSLMNRLIRSANLAHHAVMRVLGNIGRTAFRRFGLGPRRFVVGTNHVVGSYGTVSLVRRVRCRGYTKAFNANVFRRTALHNALNGGTVRDAGSLCSLMIMSDRNVRGDFTRSLRTRSSIIMCDGLPNKFCVGAPVNGCGPS